MCITLQRYLVNAVEAVNAPRIRRHLNIICFLTVNCDRAQPMAQSSETVPRGIASPLIGYPDPHGLRIALSSLLS